MTKFFDRFKENEKGVRICALSGTESVTKNLTFYESDNDIIIVDCGIGFPDSEMLGVDVVIPDMTYLIENAHKVKALFLTHGHEDHIGAVPYFLENFPEVPIYASKLVQGFLLEKLSEKRFKKLAKGVKFHILDDDSPEVKVGVFKVTPIRTNHSVPASMGFAIRTPQGTIVHFSDFKVDWTPVLDKPFDLPKATRFGDEGVLCLLSDCLGVTTEGFSKSERTLDETFNEFFSEAGGRQVLVTTISSNISRMYQIITSAIKNDRKVVLCGRSIRQNVGVARGLGYLPFDDAVFVEEKSSSKHKQSDLVYIIAGCYGQEGSGLERLSRGEHSHINLEENALVIFSADPSPPGVAEDVERVMSNLTLSGAEVIYSKIQENLHVSGHGTQDDLVLIAELIRPQYFIPIGGTVPRMRVYKNLMGSLGFDPDNVFELQEGDTVEFSGNSAKKGEPIEAQHVFVDGTDGSLAPIVIQDRTQLSDDGVFVVAIPVNKDTKVVAGGVEVITRGFVHVKSSGSLIGRSRDVVNKVLDTTQGNVSDWGQARNQIRKNLEKFLYKETQRHPLIIIQPIYV